MGWRRNRSNRNRPIRNRPFPKRPISFPTERNSISNGIAVQGIQEGRYSVFGLPSFLWNTVDSCIDGSAGTVEQFPGDLHFKCIMQLMVVNHDVVYFTFGDKQLRDDVYNIYSFLTIHFTMKKVTIGNLYTTAYSFCTKNTSESTDFLLRTLTDSFIHAVSRTIDFDGIINFSSNSTLV